MSNYKNFIQDFPRRCGKILNEYNKQTEKNGLEVTHMLSIASIAITVPFERLRKPSSGIKHPSLDREIHESANGKFANLCDKFFLKSILWNKEENSWKLGEVNEDNVNNEPESWKLLSQKLPNNYKVIDIITHIRNSISHGNIYTSSDSQDNITDIIFLDRTYEENVFVGKYCFISVSPTNFHIFLVNWIKFLSEEIKLTSIE